MRIPLQDRFFFFIAIVSAFLIVYGVVGAPSYTDSYYHFNAAHRWVTGQGLTDAYVWTYIGALDSLPTPSHLYWMPMTSVLSGLGMAVFNAPGDYRSAQFPLAILLTLTVILGYMLGKRLGRTQRHAWAAGLLTLLSPFFVRYWGAIDTFAPYALFGSLTLVLIGMASTNPRWFIWLLAGVFAACAHLTRADGLLLLLIAVFFALLTNVPLVRRIGYSAVIVIAYVIIMSPYFIRNLQSIGSALPLGGTQAIWFDEYNDIFNFPPQSSAQTLLNDGIGQFIETRREALANNIATVIAVEGLIVLLPFMMIGGWLRRREQFLHPFWLYALGMHLVMTFVFPYPGYRGGLFHSAAALIPFWSILAVIGLDGAVEWFAKRRRKWNPLVAKRIFTGAAVLLAAVLSMNYALNGRTPPVTQIPPLYEALKQQLPEGARILYDDPPELYFYTGFGGATLPNGAVDSILAVARQYDIDYVLLKNDLAAIPGDLISILDNPPEFLDLLQFDLARLYAIREK